MFHQVSRPQISASANTHRPSWLDTQRRKLRMQAHRCISRFLFTSFFWLLHVFEYIYPYIVLLCP